MTPNAIPISSKQQRSVRKMNTETVNERIDALMMEVIKMKQAQKISSGTFARKMSVAINRRLDIIAQLKSNGGN